MDKHWEPDRLTAELTRQQEQLNSLAEWRKSLTEGPERLDKKYVSQKEWKPVRAIVFGLVTLLLTYFIGALAVSVYHPASSTSAVAIPNVAPKRDDGDKK